MTKSTTTVEIPEDLTDGELIDQERETQAADLAEPDGDSDQDDDLEDDDLGDDVPDTDTVEDSPESQPESEEPADVRPSAKLKSLLDEIRDAESARIEQQDRVNDLAGQMAELRKDIKGAESELARREKTVHELIAELTGNSVRPLFANINGDSDEAEDFIGEQDSEPEEFYVRITTAASPDFAQGQIVKVKRPTKEECDEDALEDGTLFGGEEFEIIIEPGEWEIADASEARTPTEVDYSWREIKTSDALRLTEIKGFGKKKVEAFLDLCPTMGAVEDLRAAASRECKTFQEVLPKGIGSKIAEQIEEQILDFWASRRG